MGTTEYFDELNRRTDALYTWYKAEYIIGIISSILIVIIGFIILFAALHYQHDRHMYRFYVDMMTANRPEFDENESIMLARFRNLTAEQQEKILNRMKKMIDGDGKYTNTDATTDLFEVGNGKETKR